MTPFILNEEGVILKPFFLPAMRRGLVCIQYNRWRMQKLGHKRAVMGIWLKGSRAVNNLFQKPRRKGILDDEANVQLRILPL